MRLDPRKTSADSIMVDRAGRHVIFQCKRGSSKVFVEGLSDVLAVERFFHQGLDVGSYVLIDKDSLAAGSKLELEQEMEEVHLSEAAKLVIFGDPKQEPPNGYMLLRYKNSHLQMPAGNFTALLKLVTDPATYEGLLGDLQEGYSQRLKIAGAVEARRWFYHQIHRSLWSLLGAWLKQVSGLERLLRRIR